LRSPQALVPTVRLLLGFVDAHTASNHRRTSAKTPALKHWNKEIRIMNRDDVTRKIVETKVAKKIRWADVASKIGLSKEWTTAACLGQMALDAKQAAIIGALFDLDENEIAWLQTVPYKGSLPTAVPTDPLIYRFYELINVYGTTFKELIHEEFGDGIMSAIDFKMDLSREPDPKGDRVQIVMSGKFLPYKTY
jgi:cyanate lyase